MIFMYRHSFSNCETPLDAGIEARDQGFSFIGATGHGTQIAEWARSCRSPPIRRRR